MILDIENFKVQKESCSNGDQWQERFNRSLETVIHGGNWSMESVIPEDDCCDIFIDMKLYLFSGENVERFFCFPQQENIDFELFQGSGKNFPVFLAGFKK